MGVEKGFFGCVLQGNYDVGNWLFILIPHSPVIFLLLLMLQKNQGQKRKRQRYLYTQFSFCEECFPGQVEITVLPSQGVRGVSGIIFGKLWIWGSAICISVRSVYSAKSRRHNTQLRPMTFVYTFGPTGSWKKGTSAQLKYVKGTEKEFFFAPGSPSF